MDCVTTRNRPRALALTAGLLVYAIGSMALAGAAAAQTSASAGPWVKGFNSTVRLIAGALPPGEPGGKPKLIAGVELRFADGWKTYWRSPGDDGGLPPSFDWTGSKNLRGAEVRYPVPQRLKGLNGASLGYYTSVIFPVEIEADNASKPVELALSFEFGICREICVPAEAKLKFVLQPALGVMPPDLAAAYQKVPQPVANAASVLKSAKAVLTGAAPAITLDVATGAAGSKIDVFAEVVEGAFLPVAQKSGEPNQGVQRFRIDLKGVDEAPQLTGKTLRLTIAGGTASEVTWVIK
jgi:DsbC/DsbD-like thiol-disulfide interchange protein